MSAGTPARVIEVSGLCHAYQDGSERRTVLDGLDLKVAAGEVVAITGPSGSGKSTLLNLLAGVLTPDEGSVRFHVGGSQWDLAVLPETERTAIRRRHIGYVFQFFNLVPTLTVRENVLLPLELNALAELTDEALERLTGMGMGARLDAFPAHLSGGERQRTAIARALAHRPVLVLADEPTGNLDAVNAARVVAMLIARVREQRGALVLATHSPDVAARADRVIGLDAPGG